MPKIMKSLNVISRCQSIYRTAKLPCDLSAVQHSFVLAICRAPGRSQDELAKDLCLTKSSVTRALTQLEERGYVRRAPNPEDKRESLVYPEEKMLAVLPEVRRVAAEWNALITTGISEGELAVFESVLQRMAESAKSLIAGEGEEA